MRILLIVLIALTGVVHADEVLCVKKKVRLNGKKIKFSKVIKKAEDACPPRFKEVFSVATSDFASAEALQTLADSVQSAHVAVSALETETRLSNVVRVSVAGGDFSSLSAALTSLSSPSISNPYLISIGPGVYNSTEQVTIPGGVTVEGAGTGATILAASVTANNNYHTSAAIVLEKGAVLRKLTLTNDGAAGGGNTASGVSLQDIDEPLVESPGSYSTVIDNVSIEVMAALLFTGGIHNSNADYRILNSSVRVGSATTSNVGIVGDDSSATERLYVDGSSVFASGASSLGIYGGSANASVYITGSTIQTSGTATVRAIWSGGADMFVSRSTVISSDGGLFSTGAGRMNANQIQIDAADNATAASGIIACSFVSELATGAGYANTCE